MNNKGHSEFGLMGTLLIIFIVLKLTGLIAWSWWWVLSPLWIGLVVGIIILIVILIVAVVVGCKK